MTALKPLMLILLLLVAPAPIWAGATTAGAAAAAPAPLEACPQPALRAFNTAQVSQTDCCKNHKGVCGCRAGKIVCCDNTTSTGCTCHGESGFGN